MLLVYIDLESLNQEVLKSEVGYWFLRFQGDYKSYVHAYLLQSQADHKAHARQLLQFFLTLMEA